MCAKYETAKIVKGVARKFDKSSKLKPVEYFSANVINHQ